MSKSKTWLLITLTSSRFQLPAVHITPQLHLCRPGLMLTPLLNGCRAQTHCSTLPPLALLPTLSQTLTHHFHFRFAVAPNLLLALKKHAVSREPAPTGVLTPPTPPDWNSWIENSECLSAALQRPLHRLRLHTDAAQHVPICQLCSAGTVQIKDSLKDRQRQLLLKFPSVLPEDIPQCHSCDLADSVQLSDPERMVPHFFFFLHHWLTLLCASCFCWKTSEWSQKSRTTNALGLCCWFGGQRRESSNEMRHFHFSTPRNHGFPHKETEIVEQFPSKDILILFSMSCEKKFELETECKNAYSLKLLTCTVNLLLTQLVCSVRCCLLEVSYLLG